MEFDIPKDMAEALFSKASGTIPSKDVTPILKNFLIKTEKGRLRVLATDMELGAIADTALPGIRRDGICAAPAQKVLDMVSTAQAGNICFRLEGSLLKVLTAFQPATADKAETFKTQWSVHCMDPETYPEFPTFNDQTQVTVDCKKFVAGLDKISFAAAANELKVNLMAVYINDGKMFAADGHRACRVLFDSKVQDLLVPAPAVKLLVQLLKGAGVDNIGVCKTQHHILFKVGADIYHVRQLDAQFPDVEGVFKQTDIYGDQLQVEDRTELKAAINRSRVTADEESRLLALKIEKPSQDGKVLTDLAVTSRNNQDDSCVEHIPAIWTGTQPFERFVNWEYLEDVLNVLTDKRVVIRMGVDTEKQKTRYRIDENEFSSVILPVRAKKEKTEVEKAAEALMPKKERGGKKDDKKDSKKEAKEEPKKGKEPEKSKADQAAQDLLATVTGSPTSA